MKKSSHLNIAILFIALLTFVLQEGQAQTYRILPLGNSITVGWNGFTPPMNEAVSYRGVLFDQLTAAGYSFDFVGHTTAGSVYLSDPEHGAISGTRGQYVVRLLQDGFDQLNSIQITPGGQPYLDVYPADMIILHIGTNDISAAETPSAVDVEDILDEIDAWELSSGNHVTVMVARIIDRTDNALWSTNTHAYNDSVAEMIAARGDASVFMVDLESGAGIDYATEMDPDGIHPLQSAYDKMGDTWFTAVDDYLSLLPAIPGNFSLGSETSSSIQLTWDDLSGNESGFEIERSLTGLGGDFTLIHTSGAGTTSYTNTGLDEGTQYYYRVRAVNLTGPSLYTSIQTTTTLLPAPAAPSNMTFSLVTASSMRVNWQDNSTNEENFVLERSLSLGGPYTQIATPTVNYFDDSGLLENTRYYYRVSAVNGTGSSTWLLGNQITLLPAPAAPSNMTFSLVTANSMRVNWQDNSTNEVNFVLERSLSLAGSYTQIATPVVNYFDDSGLLENTRYYYRVRAVNASGPSTWLLGNQITLLPAPAAPNNMTFSLLTANSMRVNWQDNSTNETNFVLERAVLLAGPYTQIATPVVSYFDDSGLLENTRYYYRVWAVNATGASAPTLGNQITLLPAPAAPSNMTFSLVTENSLRVNWQDNSTNETNFVLERAVLLAGPYTQIATPTVSYFDDSGLLENTRYYYRVWAINATGPSATTSGNQITLLPAPAAPSNMTFSLVTSNSMRVNWQDNSTNETNFVLERAVLLAGPYTQIATPAVSYFDDSGLLENTRYYYRVRAVNASGPSTWLLGNQITLLPVPAAPSNMTFSLVTANSMRVNWQDNSTNETNFVLERAVLLAGPYTQIATSTVSYFDDSGLLENTRYYYRVWAVNATGPSATTSGNQITLLPAPAAPSNMTFSLVTSNSMRVNWQDNSTNETNFVLERAVLLAGPYTQIATPAVSYFDDSGLLENTRYYYRVWAVNATGPSTTTLGNQITLLLAPAAPSNMIFSLVTENSMRVNWQDNSTNEANFEIQRSLTAGTGFVEVGTPATSYFDDSGLGEDTEYFYRVRAVNATAPSAWITGSQTTLLLVPRAPDQLQGSATNICSVDLTWRDRSSTEEGFVVQRSNLPTGVFLNIQTLAPDSESFTDTDTENNNTYYYRIRAFNGAGEVFSNVAMVTVSVILNGGTIAADQEICPGGDPALIVNSLSPSGGSNNWSYQWQSRIVPAIFTNIPGATGITYNPPAGAIFTTDYQRISTVECGPAASNTVVITVDDVEAPQFTLCPADEVIEIDRNLLSGSFTTVNPVFTDNCQVSELTWSMSGATIGNSPLTGINYVGTRIFQLGVTTVTYVAEDLSGNSESCEFEVTVKIKDPEILSVTIPNATMKIGDIVSATIVVSNDGNSVYTLVSGNIGGYPLEDLSRISNTTYLANFVIVEGGNSYERLQNIPVGNLVVTDGTAQSLPYTTPISQNNDLLDAKRPVVNFADLVAGDYKIGDRVVINIQTDGLLYTLDPASTVNGIGVTQPNMAFVETGGGMYRLTYTVEEGDDDVAPGAFVSSLILEKPSGNIGDPFTALGNVNLVSVDAHAPLVTRIEVPDEEVGVGGVVVATITADGTGYTAASGTLINGIPLSSDRVNFSEISIGLYTLSYEVSSTDNLVAPGELEMSIIMKDSAGNIGEPFGMIEVNELEVYTQLPLTHLATLPEICEGEQAELVIYLIGREPFSIELSDGDTTLLIEDIDASPYSVFVSPVETTWYSVPLVTDRNGVENTGSGSVQVSVNASTAVNFTNLKSGYSVEAPPFKLTADIPGGVFSGPGVNSITDYFSPAVADTVLSPHTIYYTYVNPTGCTSMDSALVFVLGANGDLYIPRPKVCDYSAPFLVSASNVAGVLGTFTLKDPLNNEVAGLTDHGDNTATIDPVQLAGGVYTVEYAYTDIVKLYIRENFELIELAQPEILSPSGKTTFCQNEDAIQLIASDPAAVFSGNGVTGNVSSGFIFDPSVAPAGKNTISCKVSSETGCEKVTELVVTVHSASVAKFTIGSSCLPEGGGMVSFNNQSTSKLSVKTWRWDFGDPLSGADNYSGEIDPQHFYPYPGEWSISLTATTFDGCVSEFQVDTLLGSNPNSDFTWISDCHLDNQGVEFVNLTAEGFTPIESMKWIFMSESGDILDEVISDSDTIEYQFPNASTYLVRLQTITQGACSDTVSKMVELRPTFKLDAEGYSEAFDLDQGGWTIESEDGNASWVWGTPDFEGFTPEGNGNSWYTELSVYGSGYVEHSWIQSPCFDFSDMDRPMIKLDMMKSFVPNVNGSVLQFMDRRNEGWKAVGASSKGINWYNSVNIYNLPGGSPVGWSLDVFSPDTDWVEASHDLSALKGNRFATLRLAIATTGAQGIGNQGFAFDNLMISEKTKLAVLEHFTNSSDQNSFSADIQVDAYAKANRSEVIDLQYHTAYPGEDPMNLNNPGMVTTRAGNLGVGLVPYAVLDGGSNGMYRYDFSSIENIPGSDDLDLLSLEIPSFEIELEVDWTESDLTAYTTVTCKSDRYTEYIQLYVVVMESLVTIYEGTNGDSAFRNVVLEMLPTPAGKLLGQNWYQGVSVSMTNQWTFEPFIEDVADLVVVAFVQDRNTKEILQAAVNYKTPPTGILDRFSDLRELQVYPNPAKDYLYVNLGSRTEIPGVIEVFDLSGRMVLNMETQPGYQIFNLDIQNLTRGMYIIRRIESGELVGRSKFIKTQ